MDMSSRRCQKLCVSSSELNSSQILSNEDLLTLILLRVPVRKLMCFKSVSKNWLSLITSPHFISLRNLPTIRASGLFIHIDHPNKICFLTLDNSATSSPFRTLSFPEPEQIRILQSCRGLLLCSSTTSLFFDFKQPDCYVYNPSMDKLATLPKHSFSTVVDFIGLAFNPWKSLHYKVIAFVSEFDSDVGEFQIYSSETGTWKVSGQPFAPPQGMEFLNGVYCNGCMHWLSKLDVELASELSISHCLYFNMDDEKLKTFPRPPIRMRLTTRSLYFGESEDHLHAIEVCSYDNLLAVYEIESDYSCWFVKYQVDLAPLLKAFPEMTKRKALFDENDCAVAVLSLIRRENFQEDSFLVLEIARKAIQYNLVDGSCKVIWDISLGFDLKGQSWPSGMLKVYQYIKSISSP